MRLNYNQFIQEFANKPIDASFKTNTYMLTIFYKKSLTLILLLIVLLSTIIVPVFSQKKHLKVADSILFSGKDTIVPALINKVEAYTYTIDHTNFIIRNQLDLSPIAIDLRMIEKRLEGFKSRLDKKGNQMNLRSLNSGVILLKEIADKLSAYQTNLSNYSSQLSKSNIEVKKIIHDPALTLQVNDSILLEQLDDILTEGKSLDSLQIRTLNQVNLLRNHVSISLLQATDIISDMGYLAISLKMEMWGREESLLLKAKQSEYQQPFLTLTWQALQRSYRIITIYLSSKWNVLAFALVIFIFITTWCLSNMFRIKKQANAAIILEPVHLLKRNVLLGCLMGFFTYLPFFFANPTMSFLHLIELFRLLALSFIFFTFLTKQSRIIWVILGFLWVYYALDDLLLESAFAERWGLFFAGILLMVICLKLITNSKDNFITIGDSTATKALLIFTLAEVTLSIVFNFTGRVTLSKILGVSAIQGIILGISLKVFCTMVLEAIYLQSEAFAKSRFSDFINFTELRSRLKRILWISASIIWTISLIRNFTMYDAMIKIADTFFNEERSIGNMIFTFKSIAVFICILWFSSVISTGINFFFGNQTLTDTGKRNRLGSMMLLIRLAIWTLGFLIAVAAAGIPLDRLSLMLGALGVGIGFGLQNIVNNLVSGIILAFERPIQIGDIIEIGNKTGTVKEIGVRSSKIKNAEGADIIVPNGDLLSQQLINWTMQDNKKRIDFLLAIPYSANIEKIKLLIQDRLDQNESILQMPKPAVIIQTFGDQAIELKILCWIPDLTKASSVKSDLMLDVYKTLNVAGVHLELPLS